MTRPRRHPDPDFGGVQVGGRIVTLDQLAQLMGWYSDDHPDWAPPRAGIRGAAGRLALAGLPDGWADPYWHLLT